MTYPSSGRRRRRDREPLTRERVLQAALDFIDEHGVDALSMRRLASTLGVEAMSLYNHVEDKDNLLNGIVDLLLSRVDLSVDEQEDWKASLRRGLHNYYEVMNSHPNAARLLATYSGDEAQQDLMEAFIGELSEAGFDSETIHRAWHLCGSLVFGFIAMRHTTGGPSSVRPGSLVDRMRLGDFPDSFPYLQAHVHAFRDCPEEEVFSFSVDIVLDGLEHQLQQRRAERGAPYSGRE